MGKYQPQRGTYDAYGGFLNCFNIALNVLSEMAKQYNYKEIITPIYESTDLFIRSSGEGSDVVRKEMFSFKDRGDRDISLRPEMTAGVIRSVVSNKLYANADLPLKLFYKGPAFRYERPSKGRYRQFNQFGVETIGVTSYLSDVEVICLGYRSLQELGLLDVKLKINTLGNQASRERYNQALKDYFQDKIESMCEDCKTRFNVNILRILDCKVEEDQKIIKDCPKLDDYLDDESKEYFRKVLEMLDQLNIPYEVDNTLVRGLDYYSGVVFEYHYSSPEGVNLGAVGAGGHYPNLVSEIGGPSLECVGFAFGIERLVTLLEDIIPETYKEPDLSVFIGHIGKEAIEHSLLLADYLRENYIDVDLTFDDKSLSSQIKLANKKNARLFIVVGEDEMKNYVYQVKDLSQKTQMAVSYYDLVDYIMEKLSPSINDESEDFENDED